MNAETSKVRCRIEKIFGTVKRGCGMRRARWIGLARTALQGRLTLIGFNLRRATALLRPRSA